MATIKEDYVSFETAKLLKEKGFNGDTASCYILEDSTHRIMSDNVVQSEYYESQDSNEHGHLIQAPTHQMTMKWLREVHKIDITVYPYGDYSFENYQFDVYENRHLMVSKDDGYMTYEQACEAAIKYCLENLT